MIFKPSDRSRAVLFLDNLFLKSKYVKIEHIPEAKTLSQLRYIHMVFAHIGEQNGDRMEDIKKHYKAEFPKYEEINFNGVESIVKIDSLADFSKEQMSVFIDEVVTDARQIGFEVPDPEDNKALELYEYYKNRGVI